MIRGTSALIFLLWFSEGFAHPGIGVVIDSRGNIYYTDLRHVWRMTPEGVTEIAVRDVHTHELFIDQHDNLYGEHLWYEGESTDRWGHRVWKLSNDGELTTIIGSREGFRDDYEDFHFVRDRAGTMYWIHRESGEVRKRKPDGRKQTIARASFRNVRWMTVSPDGVVYLVDLHDLVRIDQNGNVRTIAHRIADRRTSFLILNNEHAIMGLAADSIGNVYLAIASDRTVKRVRPNTSPEIIYRPQESWVPTGVHIAPNGDLLVLEYMGNFRARVQRLSVR